MGAFEPPKMRIRFCESSDEDSDEENFKPLHLRILERQNAGKSKADVDSPVHNTSSTPLTSASGKTRNRAKSIIKSDLHDLYPEMERADLSDLIEDLSGLDLDTGSSSAKDLKRASSSFTSSPSVSSSKKTTPLYLAVTPRFKRQWSGDSEADVIVLDDSLFSSTNDSDTETAPPPATTPITKRILAERNGPQRPLSEPVGRHPLLPSSRDKYGATGSIPSSQRHPDADRYVKGFRKFKSELVQKLFDMFNKEIFEEKLPCDMEVSWNNRLRLTAGRATYFRARHGNDGVIRKAKIELSEKVCDSADRVRDTLVHEMCHAMVWIAYGIKDAHGKHWKYWAYTANRIFPQLPVVTRCHSYEILAKFTYQCVICAYKINRHSKSLDMNLYRCGRCKGRFELLVNATPRGGKAVAEAGLTPRTPREPKGFAVFVKENYSVIRKSRPGISHKEVMETLSLNFRKLKFD